MKDYSSIPINLYALRRINENPSSVCSNIKYERF